MKSRRRGSDRFRIRSARNITVPLSRETTTISRPVKSRSMPRDMLRMRSAISSSVIRMRSTSLRQRVGTRTGASAWASGAGALIDSGCQGLLWLAHSAASDVFGIVLVLHGVAGLLALEVNFVLLDVGVKNVISTHA